MQARALAERLELPLAETAAEDADAPNHPGDLQLWLTDKRLELREVGAEAAGPVYAEFTSGRAAYRRRFGGGRAQPLARAVGLKGAALPYVLDATAGLGRDAFVLASLGATVRLLERSPVVGALLMDALARAQADPEVGPIAARMRLTVAHAAEVMARLGSEPGSEPGVEISADVDAEARPDVVYLDPMYPHSGKRALQKKEMRLFRLLVGDDEDAGELLAAALTCARKRVVVKRPWGAPPLSGRKPDARVESKNTRYDLYLVTPTAG